VRAATIAILQATRLPLHLGSGQGRGLTGENDSNEILTQDLSADVID
jgi:hypothetical protein